MNKVLETGLSSNVWPLLVGELGVVAKLTQGQLSALSMATNIPIEDINGLINKAAKESERLKQSGITKVLTEEALTSYVNEGNLGYLDEWIPPEEMSPSKHPLLVMIGGEVLLFIAKLGWKAGQLGRSSIIALAKTQKNLTVDREVVSAILELVNSQSFSGAGEMCHQGIPISVKMADEQRYRSCLETNAVGSIMEQNEALQYVVELLSAEGPAGPSDIRLFMDALLNTALMVGWIKEDDVIKIPSLAQGKKMQLSCLICMICGVKFQHDQRNPLFVRVHRHDVGLVCLDELNEQPPCEVQHLKALESLEWLCVRNLDVEERFMKIV